MATLFVTGIANATPVTYSVNDNLTSSQYVSNNSNTGLFDLSAVMSNYTNADILSGLLTFNFTDDSSDFQNSSNYSSYNYVSTYTGGSNYNWQITYDRTSTLNQFNQSENFVVNAGGIQDTGVTDYYNNGSQYTGRSYDYSNYNINYWGDDRNYYTKSYTNEYGYHGNVSLSLSLNQTMIDDILNTDTLGFNFGTLSGDGYLSSAYLNVTVDEGVAVP